MNLDFLTKPIGKGFAEADTFMRREMPFNTSWGFPAALVAAYYGGPMAMEAMGSSSGGAGSLTGNGMLESLGVNGGNFTSPNFQTSFSPEYLNQLAASKGVDAGDPSFYQNLVGNNEQGLYDQFNASASPMGSNNMLARQLMNMGGGKSGGGQAIIPQMNITRQPPFFAMPEPKDIQDNDVDLMKLAMVLRNNYGNI